MADSLSERSKPEFGGYRSRYTGARMVRTIPPTALMPQANTPNATRSNGRSASRSNRDRAASRRWLNSPENLRSRPLFVFLVTGGALLLYFGFGLVLLTSEGFTKTSSSGLIVGTALAILGMSLATLGLYQRGVARAAFFERQERDAKRTVTNALGELTDVTDLATLIKINRTQMEAYEALTRRQATSSYRLSQGALAVGLVILVAGSIAVLVTPTDAAKITTASLTAMGGALTGYIARTYLRIYERTLIQLNYYFRQPLVTSYFLTAERLSHNLGEPEKTETCKQIVAHVLGSSTLSKDADDDNAEPPKATLFGRLLGGGTPAPNTP
jgi:uncharacterized membrane protein (DUF485 family)